jgi:hypothetical protein
MQSISVTQDFDTPFDLCDPEIDPAIAVPGPFAVDVGGETKDFV